MSQPADLDEDEEPIDYAQFWREQIASGELRILRSDGSSEELKAVSEE